MVQRMCTIMRFIASKTLTCTSVITYYSPMYIASKMTDDLNSLKISTDYITMLTLNTRINYQNKLFDLDILFW